MFLILCVCFYWFLKAVSGKKKSQINPYIETHQKKMYDDKMYDEYLDFCKKNGELPMEKSGFQELRMKEDKMRRKINESMR
ncbi:hypothetical protein [Chryseobacterium rhizosphaerae]|uniref:hypothetical protein n=1 Tax=Chryseobacterium rhizosphaerae TaxID=395937 RepID=UPI003D0E2967